MDNDSASRGQNSGVRIFRTSRRVRVAIEGVTLVDSERLYALSGSGFLIRYYLTPRTGA